MWIIVVYKKLLMPCELEIMIVRIIVFIILVFFSRYSFAQIEINTVWGESVIDDPLIEELINSHTFQRLKKIDQSGPVSYFGYVPHFSRYEHSIGVFDLLKRAKVSREESVAGLLHDVSHTAFSHIGDYLFYKHNDNKSYQDTIHLWFLEQQKIHFITNKYNIDLQELDPDLHRYKALELELPEICADRIQYIIHTGVIFKKITKTEAKNIVNDLKFDGEKWFFNDVKNARLLSDLSLMFTKELWGSDWNFVAYEYFAGILKRALEIGLISEQDLHFSADMEILKKLQSSDDSVIKERIPKLANIKILFKQVKFGKGDLNVKPKFRGVDPWVLHNTVFKRLSEVDPNFKKRFSNLKKWCEDGYGVVMVKNSKHS